MSAQKIPKKRTAAKAREEDDPFFDDDSDDDEPVGRVNKPKKKSNFSSDGPSGGSPGKYDTALPPPSREEHKPRWEQDDPRDRRDARDDVDQDFRQMRGTRSLDFWFCPRVRIVGTV